MASIVTGTELQKLSVRSTATGVVQFVGHVGLWCLTAAGIGLAGDTIWLLPCMIVHGIVQVAFFAGLHECVHRTVFVSKRLNDWAAQIFGFMHFLPAGYFRHFHMAHHRYTQNPERDPELARPKPTDVRSYLVYVAGGVYWQDRIRELFRHACGRVSAPFVPKFRRSAICREARWHLALYGVAAVLVVAGFDQPLRYWVVPAVLGQPFLRLYLLAEHTGCPESPEMLINTRTTFTAGLVRFLMWNMPYHVEHHAYPSVPFHRLPRLHGEIKDHLAVTACGYRRFHRGYWQALRAGHGIAFVAGDSSAQA